LDLSFGILLIRVPLRKSAAHFALPNARARIAMRVGTPL
jgi:hypothetical protein